MTNPFYPKSLAGTSLALTARGTALRRHRRGPNADRVWPWALGGIVIGVLVVVSVMVVANVNDDDESPRLVTTSRAVLSSAQSECNRQAAAAERTRVDAVNAAKLDRSIYEMISDRDLALLVRSPDAATFG